MTNPNTTDRRQFLRWSGAGLITGAAALAATTALGSPVGLPLDQNGPHASRRSLVDDRILVMIKLDGGLDFLDAVTPIGGRYHDLRGAGAIAEDGRRTLDDSFTFHPALAGFEQRWKAGELAIVHGVGLPDNSLSHFVDSDAWARGRLDVADGTGWLGRALDALSTEPDPLIGISVGDLNPALYGPGWNPVALPDDGALPWSPSFVQDNPGLVDAYQQLLGAGAAGSRLGDRVRSSQRLIREVADTVDGATDLERVASAAELFDEEEDESGGGLLDTRLSLVADLINGDVPTRAYHVAFGDFDTHADQTARLPGLLRELDESISTFQRRLGANAGRVVIATWTEFGRRPDWNGSGTDHGTTGMQFVIGADVRGGHFGDPPPLDRFDADQNFIPTTDFTRYLGGLTEQVLGVDAARVLPGSNTPMELLS